MRGAKAEGWLRIGGRVAAAALAGWLAAAAAAAHEFWIAPRAGAVAPGEEIVADLFVGRMLRGEPYPYLSHSFHAFIHRTRDGARPIGGQEGDLPAVAGLEAAPGLNILAQATIDFRATYDDWALFREFLDEEDYPDVAERHRARGLPEAGFSERYARYVKALVQAGPVAEADRDRRLGLPVELVADENPYAPGLEALTVALFADGAPTPGRRVSLLHADGETVTRTPFETDAEGRATIPLRGPGFYLISAVTLAEADADPVFYASRWAALSFRLPE